MAVTLDIGTALETAAPETVAVVASAANPATVKNVAGPVLNHHTDIHTLRSAPAFTTTAGNSQTHSQPLVWLSPTGRTTITLTGSVYGS